MPVGMSRVQWRTLGILFCHPLPLSLGMGLSLNIELGWQQQAPAANPSLDLPPIALRLLAGNHAWLFMQVLRIWTQVFRLHSKCSYLTSHPEQCKFYGSFYQRNWTRTDLCEPLRVLGMQGGFWRGVNTCKSPAICKDTLIKGVCVCCGEDFIC